jgi:hypothetical protein
LNVLGQIAIYWAEKKKVKHRQLYIAKGRNIEQQDRDRDLNERSIRI